MPAKKKKERIQIDGRWYRLKLNGKPGVELTHNGNTMTSSEFYNKIRSALRSATRFWVPAVQALELAARPYTGTNKRIKKVYECALCRKTSVRGHMHIDHVVACGALKSFEDLPGWCERAFAPNVSDYQVLCIKCNLIKGVK